MEDLKPNYSYTRIKKCSACGTEFGCGLTEPDGGCWCAELPKVVPMDGDGDCLCPTCLKAKIDLILANQASAKK